MMKKGIGLLIAFLLIQTIAYTQATAIFTDADRAYKEGVSLMDRGIFAKAQRSFNTAINLLRPVNEEKSRMLLTKAEFNFAKCAVMLNMPDSEKLMLEFIRKYAPDPIANSAYIEVANYYFNSGKYDKAISYYSQIPTYGMNKKDRETVRFKRGYAYFVKQKFKNAKTDFKDIASNTDSEYHKDANYYLGLCYFFDGDYNKSIRHLSIAEKSKRYKKYIPYYLTQIFFAQRRFDELIEYAEPRLSSRSLRNKKEVSQLVGQSYFENGNYKKALPYLEAYASQMGKLRAEEFYQLGFARYQNQAYKKAADAFKELSNTDSKIGQAAMYYLADCSLRAGDKKAARNAFANAKRMSYDKEIQEESLFNYAKLSYELKDSREALNALQTIQPTSKYYPEAQALMGDIFLSYRDYKQAMDVIEKMPNKTPQIRESYQKVALYRGMQLLSMDDLEGAKGALNKSLQFPIDTRSVALAKYWLADIANQEGNYDRSITQMEEFLTLSRNVNDLPDESSTFTGNYVQGYNYLKKGKYSSALKYFQIAADGLKRNKSFISNSTVKTKVLADATLRSGDSFFKRNKYNDALKYYNEAINGRYAGYEYAIYQKAIIEGLKGNVSEKISSLTELANDFPNSPYADDALFHLGLSYQEIDQLSKASIPLKRLVNKYEGKSDLVVPALLQLGLLNYNQGNKDAAISYYKQVFSHNPDPAEGSIARNALEEIYVRDLGQPDKYYDFLETIPGYKTDNMEREQGSFLAAETKFEDGDYTRAIQGYNEYIRKYPKGANLITAYYHRGECNTALENYDASERDYTEVINRGQSMYYSKALEKSAIIAYYHSKNYSKAFDLYSKMESSATSEESRLNAQLGGMSSAYKIGNKQAVKTMASKLISNPAATQAHKSSANFFLGKLALEQGSYSNANTYFQQVIKLSDGEQAAESRYQVAYIHYMQRDLDKSEEQCLANNNNNSGYPFWAVKSIVLLSDIYVEKNKLYYAKRALEAVLGSIDDDPSIIEEEPDMRITVQNKLQVVNNRINQSSNLTTPSSSGTLELIDDEN